MQGMETKYKDLHRLQQLRRNMEKLHPKMLKKECFHLMTSNKSNASYPLLRKRLFKNYSWNKITFTTSSRMSVMKDSLSMPMALIVAKGVELLIELKTHALIILKIQNKRNTNFNTI